MMSTTVLETCRSI